MPLIDAAGTSVAKISPDSVKNSTPPDLIWLVRKDLQVEPAVGLGLERRRHFLGAGVHGMAVRKIIGVFVGKFGGLGPRHQRRADAAQNR